MSWWAYDLVDPIVFSAMTSTADGKTLLLTHPDNSTLRWHESLFASSTGGSSWTKLLELDAGPSGYSSVEMLPNGSAAIEWSAGCQNQCSVSDKSPTCSIDPNCTRACAGQAAFCRGCDSKQHNCSVCTQGCVHCHVWDPMSPAHCAKATATHDQFAIVTLKTDEYERDSWVKKGARVLPSSIKKVHNVQSEHLDLAADYLFWYPWSKRAEDFSPMFRFLLRIS